MRHFFIKASDMDEHRAILLILLTAADLKACLVDGHLPNIPCPDLPVEWTLIRYCPSDSEADRFIAHIDAGGSVDNFPGGALNEQTKEEEEKA